jgi:predicted AAA+ superfamily ATPase
MERKIKKTLLDWKNSGDRLPLILQGARQVGKTYSVLDFGRSNFRNVIYLNFESNPALHRIFERDLSPGRILRELSVWSGESIFEYESLIFFDEVQTCNLALTSLKYFAEQAPGYYLIAAGSLLGVALNRQDFSFPVGQVKMATLYPLDFEEFLWALDQKNGAAIIRESFMTFEECSLHDTFLDYYRQYVITGGMPQAVKGYSGSGDFQLVSVIQKSLVDAYIADMAKYAGPGEMVRIMAAFNSLPAQLAKENHKFQYGVIKSGARASVYAPAIDWLKASGVVLNCNKITMGRSPLMAHTDPASFKLYFCDTGLLCAKAGLSFRSFVADTNDSSSFRVALTENYVAAALTSSGHQLFYWESQGKAEVDFVVQLNDDVIPIEVKSSDNVRAKSLQQFVSRYKPPFSFRISGKNFGFENNIKSIPLYAMFCI